VFKILINDRNDYHVQDLLALKPTEKEMEEATKWVLTQDVSEGFRLVECLKKGQKDLSQSHTPK